MNDENKDNDNYEVPPGIILPEDTLPDYPNWKKGLFLGIPGGILGAFAAWLLFANKAVGSAGKTSAIGFIMGFLMVGAIMAFRPLKK